MKYFFVVQLGYSQLAYADYLYFERHFNIISTFQFSFL